MRQQLEHFNRGPPKDLKCTEHPLTFEESDAIPFLEVPMRGWNLTRERAADTAGRLRESAIYVPRKAPPNARTIKDPPAVGTITRAAARAAVRAVMRERA